MRDSTEAKRCKGCGDEYYSDHPNECDKCIEHEYLELQRSGDVHGADNPERDGHAPHPAVLEFEPYDRAWAYDGSLTKDERLNNRRRGIDKRVWRGQQSWHCEWTFSEPDPGDRDRELSVRIYIRRNAYDDQSCAKVQTLRDMVWHNLVINSIRECACKSIHYADDGVVFNDFAEDLIRLRDTALRTIGWMR